MRKVVVLRGGGDPGRAFGRWPAAARPVGVLGGLGTGCPGGRRRRSVQTPRRTGSGGPGHLAQGLPPPCGVVPVGLRLILEPPA